MSEIARPHSAMPTIRTALGVFGFLGLLAWPMLNFIAWVFHDWKPGGAQGGLSLFQGWFRLGVVLHVALFVAVSTLISFTDGGFVILPVIFVGSVLWMLYANRIGKSKIAA